MKALCHGCFDLLHIGHIRYLQAAKNMADELIVSVTSDPYVNKGSNRPIHKDYHRAEMLEALSCVDGVIINDAPDAVRLILQLKPDIYIKGADYKDTDCQEFDAVRSYGGKVFFTDTEKFSTTELIKRIRA